jgi:hypothetical protein
MFAHLYSGNRLNMKHYANFGTANVIDLLSNVANLFIGSRARFINYPIQSVAN